MKLIGNLSFAVLTVVGMCADGAMVKADETATPPAATAEITKDAPAKESNQKIILAAYEVFKTGGPEGIPEDKRLAKALEMLEPLEGKRVVMVRNALKKLDEIKSEKGQKYRLVRLIYDRMIVAKPSNRTPEERQAKLDEQRAEILAAEPNMETVKLASRFAKTLGYKKLDAEQYAAMINPIIEHLKTSNDSKVQTAADRMQGTLTRMTLEGKPLVLDGTTIDGEDLDYPHAFEGKTVVVDFWATWCGPCVREFPNMERLYEIYHPHGFEIVGISLDDERDSVTSFLEKRSVPWTIVFNQLNEGDRGFNDPNAIRYGVTGIPTMIFVGKDGNVRSIRARGKELARLLAEAYPDVEVPAEPEEGKSEATKEAE